MQDPENPDRYLCGSRMGYAGLMRTSACEETSGGTADTPGPEAHRGDSAGSAGKVPANGPLLPRENS